MSLKSENNCGGPRFYEDDYTWKEGDPLVRNRQLWSVGSTSGGKYVSVKTADMENQLPCTVTATGEEDSQSDVVKIKCVKLVDPDEIAKTVQSWFYLKFSDGENDWTVTASKRPGEGVTASKLTTNGTPFRFMSLFSPNDSYLVLKSDKKNDEGDPLYLSSNGAGKMKLKVWNSPAPGPPRTSDEVDPALLFRLVLPLGAKK